MKQNSPFKFGVKVRTWREEQNRLVGPYSVHGCDNEKTVCVMTDQIRPFPTSMVRIITHYQLYPDGQPTRKPKVDDNVEIFWPLDQIFYARKVARFNPRVKNMR